MWIRSVEYNNYYVGTLLLLLLLKHKEGYNIKE